MYASSLAFKGLHTFPNPIGADIPPGACLQADNMVSNTDGQGESRRGFYGVGTTTTVIGSGWITDLFTYQNRLLAFGVGMTTGMAYDSSGNQTWVASTGDFVIAGLNGDSYMAGVEANKNFYLSSISGPSGLGTYKMSAFNTPPTISGVPPGLDGSGVLAGSGSGFLAASTQCAYQIVFGYTDVNGNLLLGSPSQRILVVNSTAGSDNVTLTFTVPQGLTTSYFYQVYRTIQTTYSATPSLNVPPGAEPQLSAQYNLTSGQISALSVNFTDVTTDALLGAALYTNPSQQGATQTNDRPPSAFDMCLFNQMMFYGNIAQPLNFDFSMISVGAPNGVQINDTITINSIVFTGEAAQVNASQQFAVYTAGTIAQNIDTTARNLIACINANSGTTLVYGIYLSGYNSLPGLIGITGVSVNATVTITASRGGAFSPTIPSSGTTYGGQSQTFPNGLAVSKVGQPESVPLVNINFIGGGDQPIYRILPLRDRVIVMKSDGIFVITGTTPANLSVTLLDNTVILLGRGTARLLNNSVFAFTQQGVVSITESGVTIMSRQIERDLLSTTTVQSILSFQSIASGFSYESERLYVLLLPVAPLNNGYKFPNQAYCFNWITNVWTRWPIDISAGVVNPANNSLYIYRPLGPTAPLIYKERKSYSYEDYYDDTFNVTITNVAFSTSFPGQNILTVANTPSASWVGYVLSQSQTQQIFTGSGTFSQLSNGHPITVECIGGGGGSSDGRGGGGAGYRSGTMTYTPSSNLTVTVGAGGTGTVDGANTTVGTASNGVQGSGGSSGQHGGFGGAGGFGNGIAWSGGTGNNSNTSGSGGGGASGAVGPGGNGGIGSAGIANAGGGGGGADGGTYGQDFQAGAGGVGGNNNLISGGGTGGANNGAGAGGAGGTGTGGGGGGGGGEGSTTGGAGGAGSMETLWMIASGTTYGPGGGGGGAGSATATGGAGSIYGGGAGGSSSITNASGGNGIAVITYGQNNFPSARIVNVDVSNKLIYVSVSDSNNPTASVANGLGWATGLAEVEVPIPVQCIQTPMTANFPHFVKEWGRMNSWFNGGNFQSIQIDVSSDFTPAQLGLTAPPLITETVININAGAPAINGFPEAWHTLTAIGQARYIMPGFLISFPRARISYCGTSTSYEIVSDVSG